MVGEKLGRLQIVEKVKTPAGKNPRRGPFYRCLCSCGNTNYIATGSDLRSGRIVSCGCWRRSAEKLSSIRIHGMRQTRTYQAWANMKTRVKSSDHYVEVNYDPSWESFEAFLADMGECPDDLTLDRKDTRLGYSKTNCRWATHKEQCQNRISSGKQSRIVGAVLYAKKRDA